MNYKVKLGEKLAFAMGDVGCNFIWTVVGSFLTMYYTDSVGITAGVVGTIMLVTRILDGFSDLGMGAIVIGLLAFSLYMLITGKGLRFVNSHPGSSELERKLGADKQQARAIGGLLLFITAFLLVEWIVTMR